MDFGLVTRAEFLFNENYRNQVVRFIGKRGGTLNSLAKLVVNISTMAAREMDWVKAIIWKALRRRLCGLPSENEKDDTITYKLLALSAGCAVSSEVREEWLKLAEKQLKSREVSGSNLLIWTLGTF